MTEHLEHEKPGLSTAGLPHRRRHGPRRRCLPEKWRATRSSRCCVNTEHIFKNCCGSGRGAVAALPRYRGVTAAAIKAMFRHRDVGRSLRGAEEVARSGRRAAD